MKRLNQKHGFYFGVLFTVLLLAELVCSKSCQPEYVPKRIILNITENPATSQSVTWRTDEKVSDPQAQISVASEFSDLKKEARTFHAATEIVKIDSNRTVYQYSVVLNSLQPNTLYAYRIGTKENWSEWCQFKTANDKPEPFKFVYLGDPQDEIKSMCSRIFRAAYTKVPDTRFWLFTGDIVNVSLDDNEWGEFYYALGWIARMKPMVIVRGNHAYPRIFVNGKRVVRPSHLWRPQFTQPENGPDGLEEATFFFNYQGVKFAVLDGRVKLEQQAAWLDSILSINPQRWTVVSMHQPLYSTGKDRDNPRHQELFIPIFDKYSIDVVLQGHDHNYGRTFKLRNGEKVADDERGTVYVVSVSGTKAYSLNPDYMPLMAKISNGRQLFQVLSIDDNRLKFEAFNALGELYDSFELTK